MAKYDQQTAIEIVLAALANGQSLKSLYRENPEVPAPSTVRLWAIKDEPPGFAERYALARELHADALIDEAMAIADQTDQDTITKVGKDGTEYQVPNSEWIARSRLRVDTRQWAAGRLAPRKWGDKLDLSGSIDGQLRIIDDTGT